MSASSMRTFDCDPPGMSALATVQRQIDEVVDGASHGPSCSTICTVTGAMPVAPETVAVTSDGETLLGDLYGTLPARRAAILVHGKSWDASGWREVAPLFAERDVPALALNLR